MDKISELMGFNPKEDVQHLFLTVSGQDESARIELVAFIDFDQEMVIARLDEAEEFSKTSPAGKADTYKLLDDEAIQFALVDGKMILVSKNISLIFF